MKKVSFVYVVWLCGLLIACTFLMGSNSTGNHSINLTSNSADNLSRQGVDVAGENCFAIIAGKAATTDGSVLFAHNEDDSGEQMLNIYIAPEGSQPATLEGGMKVPASIISSKRKNGRFIWLEFPGMSVADAAINQWGVAIASDGCNSREDRDDFTGGGILYDVRMNVAKYARTAREAVKIIGQAVEQFGYSGSGRTYSVADPNEGWIVSVVKGRHWVAQRVPDDKVMAIPNYYTITRVDLEDTENFAGSKDLIDYAISRGWYDPRSRQEFNFRLAYADPATLERTGNTLRHKDVIEYITQGNYEYDPYSVEPMFTPAKKMSVRDMINMLSIHSAKVLEAPHVDPPRVNNDDEVCSLDGPPAPKKEPAKSKQSPYHPGRVCTDVTIVSTIFQLRNWMPVETGCIMWMCPGRPCVELYVPWYLGMTKVPSGWGRYDDWQEAEQHHFSDVKDKQKNYPEHPYWLFVNRWEGINRNYIYAIGDIQRRQYSQQVNIFAQQEEIDKALPAKLKKSKDRKKAEEMLNAFTENIYNTLIFKKHTP